MPFRRMCPSIFVAKMTPIDAPKKNPSASRPATAKAQYRLRNTRCDRATDAWELVDLAAA